MPLPEQRTVSPQTAGVRLMSRTRVSAPVAFGEAVGAGVATVALTSGVGVAAGVALPVSVVFGAGGAAPASPTRQARTTAATRTARELMASTLRDHVDKSFAHQPDIFFCRLEPGVADALVDPDEPGEGLRRPARSEPAAISRGVSERRSSRVAEVELSRTSLR